MLEEDVNLGEMDAILLRKIEELTLYLIDLEKKTGIMQTAIDAFVLLQEVEKAFNLLSRLVIRYKLS